MRRALAVLVILGAACGHAPRFQPYTAAWRPTPPLTAAAAEVYPGDVEMFERCPSTRIGDYVFFDDTYQGRTAAEHAAELGATHVVLLQSQTFASGAQSSATAVGGVLLGMSETEFSTVHTWRVYRSLDLACLPPELRPGLFVAAPSAPSGRPVYSPKSSSAEPDPRYAF